jgi:asparagine synthase (glutamine-hydrolysing)
MRDTMRHRGPDSAGVWESTQADVKLAHRRLAIVDLSADGHQPMVLSEDRLAISFNGEIYNFRDLRRELEARGVQFKSHSDTEVILRGYEVWGAGVLDKLVGMFAFAIYDATNNQVFLARDRAGEKPLFYARPSRGFLFSSEIEPLLRSGLIDRNLDYQGLDQYLAYGYTIGNQTMVEGIDRLPAGCWAMLTIDTNHFEIQRYWKVPDYDPSVSASEPDLLDELDHLLTASVRDQLMADVPVGVMLSGGIDSSLVAAVAAKISGGSVRTFNIAFPGHGALDESAHARRVADHLGTDHVTIDAPEMDPTDLFHLASRFDEPIADSSMVCTALLSREIRQHATVALGGDGCDELFAGYRHHHALLRGDLIRRATPRFARRWAAGAFAQLAPSGTRGRNAMLALLADAERATALVNPIIDCSRRKSLYRADRLRRIDFQKTTDAKSLLGRQSRSILQAATTSDFETYLCDDILCKVDRCAMATSLETRAPWLDYRIIEFAFRRVPDHLKADRKRKKILPAELCRRYLPADFDNRRKQGFSIPLRTWIDGRWGAQIFDILRGSTDGPFAPQAVENLIRQQQQGRDHSHRLFALAFFEIWRQEFRIAAPAISSPATFTPQAA